MEEAGYFDRFLKSGRVEDYLLYKGYNAKTREKGVEEVSHTAGEIRFHAGFCAGDGDGDKDNSCW